MSAPPEKKQPKKPREPRNWPKLKIPKVNISSQLIIVVLVLFSIFMFFQYRSAKHKLQANTPAATTHQVNDIIGKVSKLVIVPTGETPTVATVKDADKLKSQTFFANAKNGDKVIVYNKSKEAILYRPSTNQIVTISTITTTPTGTTPATQ